MATAAQYTGPYLSTYALVPAAGPGVCGVCRSGPNPGYAVCRSCTKVMRQVSHPTENVISISMYKLNSQMWHVLRHALTSGWAGIRWRPPSAGSVS